jgi:hypothetical protein
LKTLRLSREKYGLFKKRLEKWLIVQRGKAHLCARKGLLHIYATQWDKIFAIRKGVPNWERESTSLSLREYFSLPEGVLLLSSGIYERKYK